MESFLHALGANQARQALGGPRKRAPLGWIGKLANKTKRRQTLNTFVDIHTHLSTNKNPGLHIEHFSESYYVYTVPEEGGPVPNKMQQLCTVWASPAPTFSQVGELEKNKPYKVDQSRVDPKPKKNNFAR